MLTPDYCVTMARYNAWQNGNLIGAADGLDAAARQADRGAFFGSIAATFSHLLWADGMWMSRFAGGPPPPGGIPGSPALYADWAAFKPARAAMDARILAWARGLAPADVSGDLTWFAGSIGREVTKPRALCFMHLFNHQIHHRGQIHAMLTAAGAAPGATDLPFMPEQA